MGVAPLASLTVTR